MKLGDVVRLRSGGPKMTVVKSWMMVDNRYEHVDVVYYNPISGDMGCINDLPVEALDDASQDQEGSSA